MSIRNLLTIVSLILISWSNAAADPHQFQDGEGAIISWASDVEGGEEVFVDGWPTLQQLTDFREGRISLLTMKVVFYANTYQTAEASLQAVRFFCTNTKCHSDVNKTCIAYQQLAGRPQNGCKPFSYVYYGGFGFPGTSCECACDGMTSGGVEIMAQQMCFIAW